MDQAYARAAPDYRGNTAPLVQPYRDQASLFDEASEVGKSLCAAANRVNDIELALFGPSAAHADASGRPSSGPPALADVTGESVQAARRLLERLEQIHRRIGTPQP